MSATGTTSSLASALRHHQEGRPAEAERAYRDILANHPDEPEALPLLGTLLLRSGRPREALPLLKRAVDIRPDEPELRLAHANALMSIGAAAEAVVAYRTLVERWPGKAAAWSNLAEAYRAQGDLRSALDAADQAVALLPGLANGHLARGNALLALERAGEAEAAYARAVAEEPGLAQAHVSHGGALLRLGRASDAFAAVRRACTLAPGMAEAHFVQGCACRALQATEAAVEAFRKAVALDPSHARAWLNLGNTLADLDRGIEAELAYRRAIDLDPHFAEAYSSLGCLLSQQARIKEALTAFECAIAIRPDYAEAHWNQGFSLLLAGDLAQGWEKYEWRKRHDRFAKTFPDLGGIAWDGEPIEGKRLLVYAEQGLGDTLQFIRYAPLLAEQGATVILACDPKLVPLLTGAPGIHALASKADTLPPYDAWVDQMSLPRIFGTRLDNIPTPGAYLKPNPARVADWRRYFDDLIPPDRRRIGIVWAGNPEHSNNARRSMSIEALKPLLGLKNTALVSLQVGGANAALPTLSTTIIDPGKRFTDFAETAAAVANLDLVIAVDTAVAHLAGAVGVPIWVLVPHAPDWRWLLNRQDTPWYESMRLFRQPTPGDWDSVMARVARELGAPSL